MTKPEIVLEQLIQIKNKSGIIVPTYTTDLYGADLFRNDDGSFAGNMYDVTDGYFISEEQVRQIVEAMIMLLEINGWYGKGGAEEMATKALAILVKP